MHSNWIVFALLVIVCCNLSVVELKRSFGIGRSRPKVSNPNIRRRGHSVADAPRVAPQPKAASAPAAGQAPAGPPPAYSANPNMAKTNPHELPPSYSSATGVGNSPNSFPNANYPRQTYTGAGTNNMYHQQPPPSYGNQNMGHMPYNNYPSGGGYSSGYGNGMMGMGMGNGMMGMGNSYGQRSSSPFGVGNILTGLAVWQLARGFGGSNHNTHIYHHYDNNQPQQTYGGGGQPQVAIPTSAGQLTPVSVENITVSEPSNHSNPPEVVTAIPELDARFPYSTIHPSLFPYGTQSESLEYWATSHTKTLNTLPSDTSDKTIISTTSTTVNDVNDTESTTISLPTTTVSV